MYQILKQILKTGIKTEPHPVADDALRTQAQSLQAGRRSLSGRHDSISSKSQRRCHKSRIGRQQGKAA